MDICQNYPNITDLSNELLCNILKYLPLREALSIAMLCRKLLAAVDMHLRLCKSIDFCQDSVYGYMPGSITDDHMHALFKKCPHLETVYGLHPIKVERRRLRKRSALTVPGIIEALSLCYHLKAVETSDLRLFEAIMQHLPQIEIIGHFQNRDGVFPPNTSQKLRLQPYPRITSLHLIGVELPELTAMPHVQHLHLQCVRFTKLQPFRLFLAHNLKSFVMKHCMGPTMSLRYLSLIIALSSSPNLSHLELVRVPLPGGLFQRAVEDSHRHQGFVNLRTLVIGGCKGMLEADIGHLMIVSSKNLETLYIQPSLTKDSLFVSLSYAQCSFPNLRNLHLGYVDTLNSSGEWSEEALLSLGLAEVPDTPSSITDSGMKVISELFPHIKTMSVSNCPHLMVMYQWMPGEGVEAWSELTDLTLQKCHCLQLSSFALFISLLPCIQVVILRDMFREPPKGCSHVGLSAGTGLGMSSAVVSNQDEHIAVQGHHQDFDHPGEEDNEENEREFIDVENEDNQEPHFMVLQRDFFDGEDDDIDVAVEGQAVNPEVLEQDREEGFNVYENQPDDNPHPYREINNNDSDASDNNYDLPKSSSSRTTNNKATCTKSKYSLRQTPKRLSRSTKSVGVQADVNIESENCDQSENMNLLIAEEMFLDSEDSCHSDDVKSSALSDKMDSNYADYDPCKPSTSKAGRHLDYTYSSDSKSYNMSDSEVDSDNKVNNKPKRLKRQHSSTEEKFQKESFVILDEDSLSVAANLSVKSEKDAFTDNEFKSHSSDDTSEDSDVELSNLNYEINPSLYSDYKLSKPCYVVITKLEDEFLSDVKISKNVTEVSNTVRPVNEISTSESESDSLYTEAFSVIAHDSCSSDASEVNISHRDVISKNDLSDSSEMLNYQDSANTDSENFCREEQGNSFVSDESLFDSKSSYVVTKFENKGNFTSDNESMDCVETQKLSKDCTLMHDGGVKLDNISCCNHELDSKAEFSSSEVDEYKSDTPFSKKAADNGCNSSKDYSETVKCELPPGAVCDKKNSTIPLKCCVHLNRIKDVKNETVTCDNSVSQASNSDVSDKASTIDQKDLHFKLEYEVIDSDNILEDSNRTSKDLNEVISVKNLPENCQFESSNNMETCGAEIKQHSLRTNNLDPDEPTAIFTDSDNSCDQEEEFRIIDEIDTSNYTSKQCKTLKNPLKCSENQSSQTTKYYSDVEKHERSHLTQPTELKKDNDSLFDDESEMTKMTSCCVVVDKIGVDTISNEKQCGNSALYDPSQPSTSKAVNDENSLIKDESESTCDPHSNKASNTSQHSIEAGYSSDNSMAEDYVALYVFLKRIKVEDPSCSSSDSEYENRKRDCDKLKPRTLKTDDDCDSCLPGTSKSESLSCFSDSVEESSNPPRTKKLKKSPENYYSSNESDFYIQIPNNTSGSVEVVNSCTGVSHKTASCSVVLHKIKNKNYKKSGLYRGKDIHKSNKKSSNEHSNMYENYNPNIPSTSKAGICSKYDTESPDTMDNNCVSSTELKRGIKRSRKSRKTVSNCIQNEDRNMSFSEEHSNSSQDGIAREDSKYSLPISASVNVSEDKKERLKISNSDAAVLLNEKQSVTEKDECDLGVGSARCKVFKTVSKATGNTSASCNSENEHTAYENNESLNNFRNESSSRTHTGINRRMERRKGSRKFKYFLRRTSSSKKSNDSHEYAVKSKKKQDPCIPMITLISEGTQATSADIRRAVRRIRRVTAQVRRSISSVHIPKSNSSHSSKISAKMVIKKPISMDPPPESYDKATSTSDPLLEDDAVQTLQLSSSTLLSFTIVSCGISDLLIDRCPKLFHIEVQACRILKKFHMNHCPSMKRLNISQCPKLSVCALVSSVLSLTTDSYLLVSYEPCMQGYHPGDGEKAVLSKTALNQSVLLFHDFYEISDEVTQASFKEKMLEWFRYLFRLHATLNYTREKTKKRKNKSDESRSSEFPWSHDLRRIHGQYVGSSVPEFCCTKGRYDILTNSPVFGEIFETHRTDEGFPAVNDCEASGDNSLLSYEAVEKYFKMQKKFIGFYIPVTDNNRTIYE